MSSLVSRNPGIIRAAIITRKLSTCQIPLENERFASQFFNNKWSQMQMSFASPESDFVASRGPNDIGNFGLGPFLIKKIQDHNEISFSSPESDFSSPRQSELSEASVMQISEIMNKPDLVLSFSSPESDFIAPYGSQEIKSYPLLTNVSVNSLLMQKLLQHDQLSFASPESDFIAAHGAEDLIKPRSDSVLNSHTFHHISYSSPESDVCRLEPVTRNITSQPIITSRHTSLSFSSPYSDLTFSSMSSEIETIPIVPTNLSFSSPESDFCSPLASMDLSLSNWLRETFHHVFSMKSMLSSSTISFSSPEADFTGLTSENFSSKSHIEEVEEVDMHTLVSELRTVDATFADIPRTLPMALHFSQSQARVITENSPPFRIVHVNQAWVDLCGFSYNEAVGSTLHILQGKETNREKIRDLLHDVSHGHESETILKNYTKSKTPFHNHLRVVPLVDNKDSERITHFLGVLSRIQTEQDEYLQYAA